MMRVARDWRVMAVVAVLIAGAVPAASIYAAGTPPYVAPMCRLTAPTPAQPSGCHTTGASLESPRAESAIAPASLKSACHPTTLAECEDSKIVIPAGSGPRSLYVRISWEHPVWSAYLYLFDPAGGLHGQTGIGCDASSYEKGCGNQTTLPLDELVVADPMPGTWTARVAAVNMHNERYREDVSLTARHPLEYAKEALNQLTTHLTRDLPVNIVFAGWKPTASELSQMKAGLTTEIAPSVIQKQLCDGADNRDLPGEGLVQHETCHYTATAAKGDPNYSAKGAVPYFEPLRYLFNYHFLAADDTWTRHLFAAMQAATTRNHALTQGRLPLTAETAPFKTAYLSAYNAQSGLFRGGKQVIDTTKVDEIDGVTVEDWVAAHRLDARYANSFTDLATGKTNSGSFINPDPTATHDPYWNGNGTAATNVDRNPQGLDRDQTFFLVDTFTPKYADTYFRPDHYHYWWTADHVKDPDLHTDDFADNNRGWGGRYRFHILDLGSAPSTYERADWVSANVAPDGGSAAFDPPIWDYRHNPLWNGSLPVTPLQAGGNTLGQVMGWEITQGLAFKYVAGYLYRPTPNDVYISAVTDVVDHYSLPSEGDLYSVDMSKVAQNSMALQALSSAAPYASFLPGPDKNTVLGCAKHRAVMVGNVSQVNVLTNGLVSLVPDPRCNGNGDAFQQAIEDGKANGSAELLSAGGLNVPTYSINEQYIRDYIDHHRDEYAPVTDGAFTVPVVNVMFEHFYNVALPLLVGGIAEPSNGGEGWGQLDNVNDALVPKVAIDCKHSAPVAPGCNGVADPLRHDYGLTYVMEHESAHFLGVNHPHDGANTVGQSPDGSWHYYYSMLKWLYDGTASPTTYAGSYGTYEVVDQERLMAGHAAEYLKQAQDWLVDAWFEDGASGRTSPSAATLQRQSLAKADIAQATPLFQQGDYLHTMYALRNASLHAKGVTGTPVAPHRMSLHDAATDVDAIFAINPQPGYGPAVPAPPATPADWMSNGTTATAASTATTQNHRAMRPLYYQHLPR